MTGRRSARSAAQAPVKYTSDSEGSDFGTKKSRKATKKPSQATPKKGTKRVQPSDGEAEKAPKRRKKSPETLALEHEEKGKQQRERAEKLTAKKRWEDWLSEHNASGKLLDSEPDREECVTQTDSQKQYGLKADELATLEHFEKPDQYGGQTKLFLTKDVKKVAFRKFALLAGLTEEKEILKKGEELWKVEHGNDAQASLKKPKKEAAPKDAPTKPKTQKQKWAAYVDKNNVGDKKLFDEPEDSINQTDSKTYYLLLPGDLVCLPHFPKRNQKYGNTTKLFSKTDVQNLAYRKAATVAGVEETEGSAEFLAKGKELLDTEITKSKKPEEA